MWASELQLLVKHIVEIKAVQRTFSSVLLKLNLPTQVGFYFVLF